MNAFWNRARAPEQRVFQAYWQDGSLDLFIGLGAVAIAIAWWFDMIWLGAVVPAMLVPFWSAFRQRLIEPRLGQVRFAEPRRRRLTHGQGRLLMLGVAALVVAVTFYATTRGTAPTPWWQWSAPALPAAIFALAGVVAAALFGIGRLAIYALVFLVAGLLVAAADGEPAWALLAGGVATATAGIVLLTYFFRHFPRLSPDID